MFNDQNYSRYIQLLEEVKEDYITFAGGDVRAGEDIQDLIEWIKELVHYLNNLERQIA